MGLLRAHLAAVSVVVFALTVVAAVFTFARPAYHPDTLPAAPTDLPYTHVRYHAAETQIAFARSGVHLTMRSQQPEMEDLSTDDLRIEVSVFGDPETVKSLGSADYTLDANNHWVHYPRACGPAVRVAAVWLANVRTIVRCGTDDAKLLAHVDRALAGLRTIRH